MVVLLYLISQRGYSEWGRIHRWDINPTSCKQLYPNGLNDRPNSINYILYSSVSSEPTVIHNA